MRGGETLINLWNPQHLSLAIGLITACLLGVIHGITPDEHTWPITFSYSIGSYSSKGGMLAGLFFSLGFTLQRAIGSELSYFALAGFLMHGYVENIVYIIVGLVMACSGWYILMRGHSIHLIPWVDKWLPHASHAGGMDAPVPLRLAFVHGMIAGWGTGAFATILYTVIAPTMPSAWLGFVPGVLFGIGTLFMQMTIGALFGWWLQRRQISAAGKAFIGRYVSGNTLFYGGLLFVVAGGLALIVPSLAEWSINTGVHVHNLDAINLGLVLVVAVVGGVGGVSMWRAMQMVTGKGI
ncbi:hypothetical protein URH17368_2691 [Alicyclobacillus hesperidum URH17-3-68]|nr:hypothetical protein URH17368_2691 [Alicyclobacillus hesperidum URH17-3-68]